MTIDGRTIATELLATLHTRVSLLKKRYGITPHLAVIYVGSDPATTSYIAQKQKTAKKIGCNITVDHCEESITEEALLEKMKTLQQQPEIHGIIVQLPLPPHITTQKIFATLDPKKDVDGFHPSSRFSVPIATAVIRILQEIFADVQHHKGNRLIQTQNFANWLLFQTIVVIGKGMTGGLPIITMLRTCHTDPIVIDTQTKNPQELIKSADMIISTVGKEHMVTPDMLKQDAILIGVGLHKTAKGTFRGDYEEESIKDIASYYTPTLGGVGPVNVACLMENLVAAAEKVSQQKN